MQLTNDFLLLAVFCFCGLATVIVDSTWRIKRLEENLLQSEEEEDELQGKEEEEEEEDVAQRIIYVEEGGNSKRLETKFDVFDAKLRRKTLLFMQENGYPCEHSTSVSSSSFLSFSCSSFLCEKDELKEEKNLDGAQEEKKAIQLQTVVEIAVFNDEPSWRPMYVVIDRQSAEKIAVRLTLARSVCPSLVTPRCEYIVKNLMRAVFLQCVDEEWKEEKE